MSDRATPETDKARLSAEERRRFARGDGVLYEMVSADFARRLERQRDALAEALRTIRDSTHKNAVTLRGIADYALAELEAKR